MNKKLTILLTISFVVLCFAGCTTPTEPGLGQKVCWKCENGLPEYIIIPDTINCGEDDALGYDIEGTQPDCSVSMIGAVDLNACQILGEPSLLTITEDKVSFNTNGNDVSALRMEIPDTLNFQLSFKSKLSVLTQCPSNGCGGMIVACAFGNDITDARMTDFADTDALSIQWKSYRSSAGTPEIIPLVRNYEIIWGQPNSYIEDRLEPRTDPTYFGTVSYITVTRVGETLEILVEEDGEDSWLGTMNIGTKTFDYFYPFISHGGRASSYVATGEFYDFVFS